MDQEPSPATQAPLDDFRCPTCGARQGLAETCRRCKCDLSLVVAVQQPPPNAAPAVPVAAWPAAGRSGRPSRRRTARLGPRCGQHPAVGRRPSRVRRLCPRAENARDPVLRKRRYRSRLRTALFSLARKQARISCSSCFARGPGAQARSAAFASSVQSDHPSSADISCSSWACLPILCPTLDLHVFLFYLNYLY